MLAALSLSDEEFKTHMQVKPDHVPAFYKSYVESVQKIIENNAELEFEVRSIALIIGIVEGVERDWSATESYF